MSRMTRDELTAEIRRVLQEAFAEEMDDEESNGPVRKMVRQEIAIALAGAASMAEDDGDGDDDDDRDGGDYISVESDDDTPSPPRKHSVKRNMACIAPKCSKRSKGPRFKYLCDDHIDSPVRKIKEWQEIRRDQRA